MKRDMDLVREILLKVESESHGFARSTLEIPGYTQEQINYHAVLLGEAGLVKIIDLTSHDSKSPEAMITSLTWAGYEFLDSAREKHIWEHAKNVISKVGGASIQIWVALLTAIVKRELGL